MPRGKILTLLSFLAGLGLTVYLVRAEGWHEIRALLRGAGWPLLLLPLAHIVPIFLDAISWRWLLDRPRRVSLLFLTWLALLREAVNALLPVARIGGEVVGVRLLGKAGVPLYTAAASVLVEVSLTLASQLVFTLAGLIILLATIADRQIVEYTLVFLLAAFPAVAVFFWLQSRGRLFARLQSLSHRFLGAGEWLARVVDLAHLDHEIQRIYGRNWALLWANFWQLAGLFAGAVEVWLTFWLLGHPIPLWSAVLLESLGQALRSAAFFVPGGLGVQEGGFLLLGAAVGIGPDLALAFSLARRLRELLLGVPLLGSWYIYEGQRWQQRWRRQEASREGAI
ncbi:hypothetical protein BAE30_15375 [Acidithiobacillus caldus]|uniref:Uncharacterized protein n=1 Tax=Acidithiobacillus caldus TaxID=33059 RepID=A0A1E7YSB8_9PROT|nr:hypothetical protein BAE30_15375 [Acidithiobacillus caldus]